jgi:thioesterase domain-containing protein/acyl carrier protein
VGYLNQPQRTAERFVAAPGGRRRYATGDVARWRADGAIEFLGRVDNQVKLRGYRIELDEVASVLREASGVRDAVAVVVSQPSPILLAALVLEDQDAAVEEVRAFVGERLPTYMVPAVFRVVPHFPRTPNGKLDHGKLAEKPVVAPVEAAPVSEVQHTLAAIWCRLLHRTRVDVTDDFFAVGGNSLLATWLVRELDSEFGIELPLQTVFSTRTLSAMATALETCSAEHTVDATGLVVPLATKGEGVPLIVTHPLGGALTSYEPLLRLLADNNPVWGIRSPEIAGSGDEPSQVSELVQRYTDELLDRIPARTMALHGWSFGGLASLALAEELEKRGVAVVFVEMWDCGLDISNPLGLPEMVPMAVRAAYGEHAATLVTPLARALPRDATPDHPQVRALLAQASAASWAIGSVDGFDRHLSIIARQAALFRTWMPTGVNASLHVVLAEDSLRTGSVHQTDWSPYTAAGWTEDVVRTDHYGMVRFPTVAESARGLLRRLRIHRPAETLGA